MFGYRSDGKKVKNMDPIFKIIPHIMKKRSDAQVYYFQDLPVAPLDEYINAKEKEGIKISYMHIIYAAIIRVLAEKPRLNRFVVNGRLYSRNKIYVSLVVKKGMSETANETNLKIPFEGSENIFEIKERLDKEINANKEVTAQNNMDKLVKVLTFIPNFVMRFAINIFIFLDRIGLLPKKVLEASPFHTSAYLTNVGSLGIDAIYHHIYDFGTTSIFLAMGKKKKSFVYEDDAIIETKTISLAWVADERICDGYYYANAFKTFSKYLKKPELLEQNIEPKKDI